MIIIDLIGQPCSGKSTLSSDLFSALKKKGYNVDNAPEYAKELVYEKNFWLLDNQLHVYSEQLRRIKRLEDNVEIIISDTSLLLSLVYYKGSNPYFNDMVLWDYNNLNHMTYYLKASFPYKKEGRHQDEENAKLVDVKVKNIVDTHSINCTEVYGDVALEKILLDLDLKMKK